MLYVFVFNCHALSVYMKNGPPSSEKGLSTAHPRLAYAICSLRVTHSPPGVPPFLYLQNPSPGNKCQVYK